MRKPRRDVHKCYICKEFHKGHKTGTSWICSNCDKLQQLEHESELIREGLEANKEKRDHDNCLNELP